MENMDHTTYYVNYWQNCIFIHNYYVNDIVV